MQHVVAKVDDNLRGSLLRRLSVPFTIWLFESLHALLQWQWVDWTVWDILVHSDTNLGIVNVSFKLILILDAISFIYFNNYLKWLVMA